MICDLLESILVVPKEVNLLMKKLEWSPVHVSFQSLFREQSLGSE